MNDHKMEVIVDGKVEMRTYTIERIPHPFIYHDRRTPGDMMSPVPDHDPKTERVMYCVGGKTMIVKIAE